MKHTLLMLFALLQVPNLSQAQIKLGVKAALNVPAGQTVLFGDDTTGSIITPPVSPRSKLIWYGRKGAFRAGGVATYAGQSDAWDSPKVGAYSFAAGVSPLASGYAATSLGESTTAVGDFAISMGHHTVARARAAVSLGESTTAGAIGTTSVGWETAATGDYSTSMGLLTKATGSAATSMGYKTTASGGGATSMGEYTIASGYRAVSLGYYTTASGDGAISAGVNSTANSAYSLAIGSMVSTNRMDGSFILGDYSSALQPTSNTAPNQMMMRFRGGYIFYTSPDLGVQLAPNGNAWQTLSDSSRKEHFQLADETAFLAKISRMRLGSWNYKGQDPTRYRHWGPMAQDFYTAFGYDGIGVIGEEKSINQADFDGVNLIAIQALTHQVEQLKAQLSQAQQREKDVQARLDKLESLVLRQADQRLNAAR